VQINLKVVKTKIRVLYKTADLKKFKKIKNLLKKNIEFQTVLVINTKILINNNYSNNLQDLLEDLL